MFEFKLPDLGEGIAEGEILKWYVEEGGPIVEDEPLMDVETDKAVVEVESTISGTLLKIIVTPNQTVPINTPIAIIEEDAKSV